MIRAAHPGPPELWAGVECTVNRVGDGYFDQLKLTGHEHRIDDLDRLAWLGAKAVRYPVLWERTVRDGWEWSDRRLPRLRDLGVRPVVGLVHHGSGPAETNLLDRMFPERLAHYAGEVAARYPWVQEWTPVNEPGTTARFAGLYGHWYPHARNVSSFARALINECRATICAMRAIRGVNPGAKLVQTEDLGRVFGTPVLKYQTDYENARRLLSLDLLCGRVTADHVLRSHLIKCGIAVGELDWFVDNATPPDVIGINYYLTSDRFLDDRLEHYPAEWHGGNGRHRYVDIEAVRVKEAGIAGHRALLDELWDRYGVPLAITELHAGCTREEQLRWMAEGWQAAVDARADGVAVQAVTLWSAFGASDWDKLVTRVDGEYEPGLFDVRADPPRPTALAHQSRALAELGRPVHPVAAQPGWWRRVDRVLHPGTERQTTPPDALEGPPLLITGAPGTLARALARVAATRGLAHRLLSRRELDIADPAAVEAILEAHRPWAVINAAGYVRVDDAEREPERCFRDNVAGPAVLAAACKQRGVRLVTFSSDLVFNGQTRRPYIESAPLDPLGIYGASKAQAEHQVQTISPEALIVRTAAFFGPWDDANFVKSVLRTLTQGQVVQAAEDLIVSPTYVPDLVHATMDLLVDGESGVWHLANPGAVSWAELARQTARLARLDDALVHPCAASVMGYSAARPPFSALGSERGRLLRPLDQALEAFVQEHVTVQSTGLAA